MAQWSSLRPKIDKGKKSHFYAEKLFHLIFVSGLWTLLMENEISLKTVISFIAFLLHNGNKVGT